MLSVQASWPKLQTPRFKAFTKSEQKLAKTAIDVTPCYIGGSAIRLSPLSSRPDICPSLRPLIIAERFISRGGPCVMNVPIKRTCAPVLPVRMLRSAVAVVGE